MNKCCCQFNPSEDQEVVLASNCCPVHNINPIPCQVEPKCEDSTQLAYLDQFPNIGKMVFDKKEKKKYTGILQQSSPPPTAEGESEGMYTKEDIGIAYRQGVKDENYFKEELDVEESLKILLQSLQASKSTGGDVKPYICTDCEETTFVKDNGEVRVGFCSSCGHPLWNDAKN